MLVLLVLLASCRGESVAVCSLDRSAVLVHEGLSNGFYACPGPNGCTPSMDGGELGCDLDGTEAGSRCWPDFEGHGACSSDGGEAYLCNAGVWSVRHCRCGDHIPSECLK